MKRMIPALALSLALGTAAAVRAGEHPKEHPSAPSGTAKSSAGGEHPAGHEHPVGSKAWTKEMNKEFTKAVEDHVAQKSAAEGGAFKIQDETLGKEWALSLVGVHKKRVVHLGDQHFFACADFKTAGNGKKDKLDLDFYASKTADGWKIDKTVIHKVNGKPRYTYNEKNGMVPVKD